MEKPPSCTMTSLLLLVFFFVCGVVPVLSDGSDHIYKVGDDVPLCANKVGPFHNPSIGDTDDLPESLVFKLL